MSLQTPVPSDLESSQSHTNGFVREKSLGGSMVSISANAGSDESIVALIGRLSDAALARGLVPIQGNAFCDPALGNAAANLPFPVAFLGRHDTPAGCVLSARITALPKEIKIDRVLDERGAVCGAQWETPDARYLLLGALTPPDVRAARDAQSADVWQLLKARLEHAGFTLGNLVRTWFFNDHILDWYTDFNRVRNAFFTEHNIFGTLVPASTGVGASNAAGAALSLDALAVAPKSAVAPRVSAVTSPLQCAAYDYKSAFSRAVECADADGSRHLLVSGTASIEPGGKTIHLDDLDAQIDLSLRVVEAILKSRDMDWRDTARAILYFPRIEWMPRWEARRTALGIPPLPAIFAHCDICRDDLLFEIELDAWKKESEARA
ncbi:enamine deaminase RidA (YjgF/YER057c/UK114 family) [Ereboglobus sp. PH5-5]|uniref:translation initiation inhibitor n=1 Tax=Ereboglobus sp. PH5-5 TaxID=2940529 RepID=UPI002406D1D4|nr:translation initiation inhibitor [Ereboglobus sp. PH5-5]MDF9832664.1 enamine deaminase RidA (YjgF/YER057c/UK114 family) [Ereboglobus sp. PH5-5]